MKGSILLEQDPPGNTVSPFWAIQNFSGSYLDGDSDSPIPSDFFIIDVISNRQTVAARYLSSEGTADEVRDNHYVIVNRKQKGGDYIAPNKKEQQQKRRNIISIKLTDAK